MYAVIGYGTRQLPPAATLGAVLSKIAKFLTNANKKAPFFKVLFQKEYEDITCLTFHRL